MTQPSTSRSSDIDPINILDDESDLSSESILNTNGLSQNNGQNKSEPNKGIKKRKAEDDGAVMAAKKKKSAAPRTSAEGESAMREKGIFCHQCVFLI